MNDIRNCKMFIKRRPVCANVGLEIIHWQYGNVNEDACRKNNRRNTMLAFLEKHCVNQRYDVINYYNSNEEFISFDGRTMYSRSVSFDFETLWPTCLLNSQSVWLVYFESSCTLHTKSSAITKMPKCFDEINAHIVTRQQARFEAVVIFMGYVRRALKKQIAESDNLRVIVHCIEQSLFDNL